MLKLIFLGNCGLYLSDGTAGILIDCPNGLNTLFDSVSEEAMAKIAAGKPPYDGLYGALFSHRHNDHYDKKRLNALCAQRPDLQILDTNGATPQFGAVRMGPFSVQYAAISHSGNEFATVPHRVFWITVGEDSVYYTGDAWWHREAHIAVWRGRTPTVGIWNPNFITHEDGRYLMQQCRHNVICHMPVAAEDVFGIKGKCASAMQQFGTQIPDLTCITAYPSTVTF